jgi:hypothetical protein
MVKASHWQHMTSAHHEEIATLIKHPAKDKAARQVFNRIDAPSIGGPKAYTWNFSNSRFLATALALSASKLLTRLLTLDENVNCEGDMLWTLFVILLVLWLLGVVSSYTMGGFIHILLVLALVALVFQLITGRRAAV